MPASAKTTPATDLALIAVFAALIAAFSLTPAIPVAGGVPITLQTLAVVLAGLVLGPVRGFLAALLYVLVGMAGLLLAVSLPWRLGLPDRERTDPGRTQDG